MSGIKRVLELEGSFTIIYKEAYVKVEKGTGRVKRDDISCHYNQECCGVIHIRHGPSGFKYLFVASDDASCKSCPVPGGRTELQGRFVNCTGEHRAAR